MLAAQRGLSREAMALSMVESAEMPAIATPRMAACLEKMTDDYARILKRIDSILSWAESREEGASAAC